MTYANNLTMTNKGDIMKVARKVELSELIQLGDKCAQSLINRVLTLINGVK